MDLTGAISYMYIFYLILLLSLLQSTSHQPFSPNPKLILGSTDYYASHFMGPPLAAHFLSPLAYFLLLCLLLILSPLLYNLSSTGQKAVSINYYYSPSM